MKHGYDSPVGERGLTLSGGQRQRIGIARAIIRNTPILILDEPTAALDTESERLVIEGLERLMKGRTVITIAHRLSTIRDADKIIVLKDGVVAEQGTHDELVALGGVYAELHRIQYEQPPAATARRADAPSDTDEAPRHGPFPDRTSRRLRQPILDAIAAAKKSLRIKMFVFSDPSLIAAVIAAQQRGVKVRVMLNPARRSGEAENEASRSELLKGGRRGRGQQSRVRPHAREVDGGRRRHRVREVAQLGSGEPDRDPRLRGRHRRSGRSARDHASASRPTGRASAFDPGDGAHLIWCNNNGRERIAHFIDQAKHTLFVQNERYQDPVIIERLVRARERGVKVHVMARPPHTLKKDKLLEGVERAAHHGRRRHQGAQAEASEAARQDAARRREGGDHRLDQPRARQLRRAARARHRGATTSTSSSACDKVARHDWEHSEPLDLTDEGLLADLEKRHSEQRRRRNAGARRSTGEAQEEQGASRERTSG